MTSETGHERRLTHPPATSAITLNADIPGRGNICRNGHKQKWPVCSVSGQCCLKVVNLPAGEFGYSLTDASYSATIFNTCSPAHK